MNKYNVQLKATDSHGLKFLDNVIWLASMGGVLDKNFPTKNTFPNQCMFYVETDQQLKDDMPNGIRVWPVEIQYSKEQLDKMEWMDFKAVVKQYVPKGRDRQIMTSRYLEACKTGVVSDSEE